MIPTQSSFGMEYILLQKCWQAEDDVIDALGTLAAWLGLVQEPFPTPSQYQSLLDSIRDDEALVKEIEEIYGSELEKRDGNGACARVKGPPRDCLSNASMETSAQALRVLETSMKYIHNLLGEIRQLIGSLQADEMDGLRVEDVSMVDCLLENAPILVCFFLWIELNGCHSKCILMLYLFLVSNTGFSCQQSLNIIAVADQIRDGWSGCGSKNAPCG